MKIVKIDKSRWQETFERLFDSYRVFAPVKQEQFHNFRELGRGEKPDFDCLNTRLSPKSLIYPQSEAMLVYSLDENEPEHHVMKEAPKDYSPHAVFGIRPCDAKAFQLVRKNFDTPEYQDPYWLRAYENTTFVGLACHSPCNTCFCTTAGCGPFHAEGLDLLLVDAGDDYWAEVLTAKGQALLDTCGWDEQAAGVEPEIEAMRQAAEARITSHIETDKLGLKDTIELHQAPFWEGASFSCINCGTCTFVCPTCWCFDVQDEKRGKSGMRMRNWDSCMFPLFTLHGSGHNPRGTKLQRVRQRFMHKLKYYVDKYDSGIQCVGCGRCVRLCPVNIDIRRVCELMNSYPTSTDDTCVVS